MIWMQFGGFNSQWKPPSVFNWRYSGGTEHCDYHSDKHIVSLFRSSLHPITSDTLETVLAQSGICWYGCMWYNGTVVTVAQSWIWWYTVYLWCTCVPYTSVPRTHWWWFRVEFGVPVVYKCTVNQVHSARWWFGMEASIGFNSRSSLQLELEKMENSSISDWANFAKL